MKEETRWHRVHVEGGSFQNGSSQGQGHNLSWEQEIFGQERVIIEQDWRSLAGHEERVIRRTRPWGSLKVKTNLYRSELTANRERTKRCFVWSERWERLRLQSNCKHIYLEEKPSLLTKQAVSLACNLLTVIVSARSKILRCAQNVDFSLNTLSLQRYPCVILKIPLLPFSFTRI